MSHAAFGNGPTYQVVKIIGAIVLTVCVVIAFKRMLAASEERLSGHDE